VSDLEQFRAETRTWLEENCPPEMRTPMNRETDACWGGRNWVFQSEDQKIWLERMVAKGWTAPSWPKEYGGAGLSRAEDKILKQEMKRISARPALLSFGIWMLGPALLKFGSEEQKCAIYRKYAGVKFVGVKDIASRMLALTWRLWRPNVRIRATISWSMVPKFGQAMQTKPTGFSV